MKCLEGQYHKSIRAFIPSWLDATPEALGPCRFNLDEPACLAHVWEQWFKQNHSLPPPLAPTPRRCWRKSNGDQPNAMQNLRTSINTSSVSEPRRAAHKLRVAASVLPASWCMSRRPLVIRSASVNDSRRCTDATQTTQAAFSTAMATWRKHRSQGWTWSIAPMHRRGCLQSSSQALQTQW